MIPWSGPSSPSATSATPTTCGGPSAATTSASRTGTKPNAQRPSPLSSTKLALQDLQIPINLLQPGPSPADTASRPLPARRALSTDTHSMHSPPLQRALSSSPTIHSTAPTTRSRTYRPLLPRRPRPNLHDDRLRPLPKPYRPRLQTPRMATRLPRRQSLPAPVIPNALPKMGHCTPHSGKRAVPRRGAHVDRRVGAGDA